MPESNENADVVREAFSKILADYNQQYDNWRQMQPAGMLEDLEHICTIQNIYKNILNHYTSYNPEHRKVLNYFDHPLEALARMYEENVGFHIDNALKAALEKMEVSVRDDSERPEPHEQCMAILDSKIAQEYAARREEWEGLAFETAMDNTHMFLVVSKAYDCLKNRREQFSTEQLDLLSQRSMNFLSSNKLSQEWRSRAETLELSPLLESLYDEFNVVRPANLKQETTLAVHLADGQIIELPINPYDLPDAQPEIVQITVHTVDRPLNEALSDHTELLKSASSSLKEADLLAYFLSSMDAGCLQQMQKGLPSNSGSTADLITRALYHANWQMDRDGRINSHFIHPDTGHCYYHETELDCLLHREWEKEIQRSRITGGELFSRVVRQARESGDMACYDPIIDYILPDEYQDVPITKYEFDFVPEISFGGSEGIYIDCYLSGEFADHKTKPLKVGTIKTLNTDLEACKRMGELCGVLMYHEGKYVGSHLELFTPFEELEHQKTEKLQGPRLG